MAAFSGSGGWVGRRCLVGRWFRRGLGLRGEPVTPGGTAHPPEPRRGALAAAPRYDGGQHPPTTRTARPADIPPSSATRGAELTAPDRGGAPIVRGEDLKKHCDLVESTKQNVTARGLAPYTQPPMRIPRFFLSRRRCLIRNPSGHSNSTVWTLSRLAIDSRVTGKPF